MHATHSVVVGPWLAELSKRGEEAPTTSNLSATPVEPSCARGVLVYLLVTDGWHRIRFTGRLKRRLLQGCVRVIHIVMDRRVRVIAAVVHIVA